MKIYVKAIFIVLAAIAGILIACAMILYILLPHPLSKRVVVKSFTKSKESITIITNYLIGSDYDVMIIDNTNYTNVIWTNLDGNIIIDDAQVVDMLKSILKCKGYQVIAKEKKVVYLQRSSSLDFGNGVAYSIDGRIPDGTVLQFLTKIEPLDEDGWYYYEEDFNEWKRRNRQ